jgi:hypothetical protein
VIIQSYDKHSNTVPRKLPQCSDSRFKTIHAQNRKLTEGRLLGFTNDFVVTVAIIIIIIMNYISTRYNFTYTKINYVQDIKRKKGDLPTGRAHTSRNKK